MTFIPDSDEISVTDLQTLQQQQAKIFLLDVREPFEHELGNLGGKLIPLNTLPEKIHELDPNQHIVVYCKVGGRSRYAVNFLKAQGFAQVSNLTGGILAWKSLIDPSIKI
jgi:rhodanese-related sulfurtransferase